MFVKITKVQGGKMLRTKTIEGPISIAGKPSSSRLPEVGEQPVVFGTPLDPTKGNVRIFNTSVVASLQDVDGGRRITTESGSVYFIEVVERAN